ncbi:hypothetical protein NL676_002095 [Syzygium grande]|nr:hypothetical protein NL676_002095 [Syzygium grande]
MDESSFGFEIERVWTRTWRPQFPMEDESLQRQARHSHRNVPVELDAGNTFVRVVCFASKPSQTSIYSNLAQMNYLIGYDTRDMKLSFKPVDCTSY